MSTDRHQSSIADLYPELSESEARDAEERLHDYVELIVQIAHRVQRDPEKWKTLCELTGIDPESTLNDNEVIEW